MVRCVFRETPDQLFEELYGLLSVVLPGLGKPGTRAPAGLDVALLEHSRYTSTFRFHHRFAQDGLIPDIAMTVRAYHDARVAEVIAYQGCDRLPPPYAVNGNPRYVRDERRQVNRFLRQILRHNLVPQTTWQHWRTPDAV